jgi:uncharacterized protein (UPF0548 family)
MWHLQRPTDEALETLAQQQAQLLPTYPEVGSTRGEFPLGYEHDRNEIKLGSGEAVFAKAVAGLRAWKMFPAGWTEIFPPQAPQSEGGVVILLFRLWGIHWTSAARIIYEVEETNVAGAKRRVGFAYGTLPGHVECGEERFTITWREDDSVWYQIQAFSRPYYWMTRLAKPLARRLQRRFVRDSKAAMQAYVTA